MKSQAHSVSLKINAARLAAKRRAKQARRVATAVEVQWLDYWMVDMNTVHSGHINTIDADEMPVFWGCGVTPQAIAIASGVSEMITHATGHLFATDLRISAHRDRASL